MKALIAGAFAFALSATAVVAEEWKVLVSPSELVEVIEAEAPIIIDVRGAKDYASGHLPGAMNLPYPAWRGPAKNPGQLISDSALTRLLSGSGITPDVPVIVTYPGQGTTEFGAAARVYWTLKSAGVERIAILNGGIASWKAAGFELSTDLVVGTPTDEVFSFSDDWKIEREDVQAVIDGTTDAILVDARPDAFFEGRKKHKAAAKAGTLAGAVNLFYETWFGDALLNTNRDAVRAGLAEAGIDTSKPIVSFCNTGHWAATNWFVLSEVGEIEGVKLYPESMVGWTGAGGPVAHGG